MDTLCFDAPILLRHLTFSEQRKEPIQEIHMETVLAGLGFTREQVCMGRITIHDSILFYLLPTHFARLMRRQFIDMCILLGCDYCDTIPKVGPHTALKMIREHKTIEKVIANLGEKYKVPEDWPFNDARGLFAKPDVVDPKELDFKWEQPDIEGLMQFLVQEKGFNDDRVRNGAARLQKGLKTSTQGSRYFSSFSFLGSGELIGDGDE
jgi:flap endonuclease-1